MSLSLYKWEMRKYRVHVRWVWKEWSMSLSIATNTEGAPYPVRTSLSTLATV